MRILFWDIDGTLLRTGKAGLYAFQQVAREKFGENVNLSGIQTAGMTDCYITGEILEQILKRSPSKDERLHFLMRYEQIVPEYLARCEGHLLPNVLEILKHFSRRPDFCSLLLTGNTATGAKAKLTHYGINRFFDFTISAFGDSCANRCELSAHALSLVRTRYPEITPDRLYVIGDTPNDITCGKAIGARTVAVATGRYSIGELLTHAPWWASQELPAPPEFEKKLLS